MDKDSAPGRMQPLAFATSNASQGANEPENDSLIFPTGNLPKFIPVCLWHSGFLQLHPSTLPGLLWSPLNVLSLFLLTFAWFQGICGISTLLTVSLRLLQSPDSKRHEFKP